MTADRIHATLFGSTQRGVAAAAAPSYYSEVLLLVRTLHCVWGRWEYISVPTFRIISLLRYFSSFSRVTDNQSESYTVSRKVHIIIYINTYVNK